MGRVRPAGVPRQYRAPQIGQPRFPTGNTLAKPLALRWPGRRLVPAPSTVPRGDSGAHAPWRRAVPIRQVWAAVRQAASGMLPGSPTPLSQQAYE